MGWSLINTKKNQRENKKMGKQGRVLISLTAIVVILALVIGGCSNKKGAKPKEIITHPNANTIAGSMLAYFPPGVKVVRSEQHVRSNGSITWAVLEIDRKSLDPFIKGMPENKQVSEESRLGVDRSNLPLSNAPDWWKPDEAKKFIAIDTSENTQFSQGLLIDLDGDKMLTIYVVILL